MIPAALTATLVFDRGKLIGEGELWLMTGVWWREAEFWVGGLAMGLTGGRFRLGIGIGDRVFGSLQFGVLGDVVACQRERLPPS